MARAAWKFPYVPPPLHEELDSALLLSAQQRRRAPLLMTHCRNTTITSGFLYRRVAVHNGRTFAHGTPLPCHLGRKLGAVAFCKQMGIRIHLDNRLAKKKREQLRAVQQKKLNRAKGRTKKKPVKAKKKAIKRNG